MYLKLLAFICCLVGMVSLAQAQKTPTPKPKSTTNSPTASTNKNIVRITSEQDLAKYAKQLQADSAQADNEAADLLDSLDKAYSEQQAELDDIDKQEELLLEWYGTLSDDNTTAAAKSTPKPANSTSKSTKPTITRTTIVRKTHQ